MFKLNLGDEVELSISGEKGVVIGRAEYAYSGIQYYVSYTDGNKCLQDKWFYEQQLTKI